MESNQISIRIAGPSGSGKQSVVNFIMAAFRSGGNAIGPQMEGTMKGPLGNIPYDAFDVKCATALEGAKGCDKWGLSKNKVIRIPKDILTPRLSTVIIKQGFTPLVDRHSLIDAFLESVGDDYSGSLANDGISFEADRARHMFEGFCMGRGVEA